LKHGGRMIISDLVTDKEMDENSVNVEKWCSCIDGALTKENYLDSIRKSGFNNPEVLQETTYLEDKTDGRIIISLVVRAIK
jgi:arsenite methyltransferase